MFKKLISDQRTLQLSHRPLSPSRSITPSKIPHSDIFVARKDQIIRSPLKDCKKLDKQVNQYLNNHLQRKCTSPIKGGIRPQTPLARKNTQPQPNNRSPIKTFFPSNEAYSSNRLPQSCQVEFLQSQEKQNVRSNLPLFANIIKDQNVKIENFHKNKKEERQQKISFTSILKKQQSLGIKFNQGSFNHEKKQNSGSVTTTDFSSDKKLSFKDSLKVRPKLISQSFNCPIILEIQSKLNDSIGTISKDDRVNQSIMETSLMDLNMDPCFDM